MMNAFIVCLPLKNRTGGGGDDSKVSDEDGGSYKGNDAENRHTVGKTEV
jgi:hypothetical protein